MVIRDVEDLTTAEYLSLLISYLNVLQEGRSVPNKNPDIQGAYIKESVYNIDDIRGVKEKINDVFRIIPKTVEFDVLAPNKRTSFKTYNQTINKISNGNN